MWNQYKPPLINSNKILYRNVFYCGKKYLFHANKYGLAGFCLALSGARKLFFYPKPAVIWGREQNRRELRVQRILLLRPET